MSKQVILIIWVLFVFEFPEILAETCEKIDDCSCRKSNGKVINLREIDGGSKEAAFKNIPTVSPPGSSRYIFDWNPCTKISEGDGCKNMLVCQKDKESTSTYPCANTVSAFIVNGDGTTTIDYQQYIESGTGYKRVVKIKLMCDESKYPGATDGVSEDYQPLDSTYSMTFKSKCACDDGCVSNNPSGSGNTGLSTGSILLIVFFVLLFVYLIGGIVIKKYKMGVESMPEMIPNYEFWAGIPSLVKDGIVFTCTGLKSGCTSLYQKRSKGGYAEI